MIYAAAILTFFTAVGWLKARAVVRKVYQDLQIKRAGRPLGVGAVLTFPLLSLTGLFYMLAPTFSTQWMTYGVVVGAINDHILGKPEAKAYLSRKVPESPWQNI